MTCRHSILLLVMLLSASVCAGAELSRPAVVKTRDGQTFSGPVRFEDDTIVITSAGLEQKERRLKLSQIASVLFSDPAPPAEAKNEKKDKAGEAAIRLGQSSPSRPRQIIPESRLSPPLGDPGEGPRVSLISPRADRWRIAPGALELEASVSVPRGSIDATIARVEFFAGNTLLGTATAPPYRYTWVRVPPGHHQLTARATDSAGTVTASAPVALSVGSNGAGTLPAPWGSMLLGALDRADSSSYSGGLFTIRAGGGELRGAFDSAYFIAQPLEGDRQITARIGDIGTDAAPNSAAGVMIRESLSGDSRYAAILAGKDGIEYLCRREPASWVSATDINRSVPCYLRLVRSGRTFKAYASDNQTSWQLIGSDQLPLGSQTYIGLIATSRADDALCTVTVDHVQVEPGPPPMDASSSGVRLRGGSFLAGEIRKAEPGQVLLRQKKGKELALPTEDVARILLRPVPMELASNLGRGRAGVLLAGGDFYEGEFRGIKDGRVTIDSVVFGPKRFEPGEVLAVVLHDVVDSGKHAIIRTSDGSVYAPKSLKLEGGRLQISDESAGEVSVSLSDVVEIRP